MYYASPATASVGANTQSISTQATIDSIFKYAICFIEYLSLPIGTHGYFHPETTSDP
jgi:hypothetical protein